MIILGITGGSGCGKTTVSNILKNNDVDIIDCDLVAKKIVEPDMPALKEIKEYFGDEYINTDKALNRKMLAATVFSSKEKLEKLNEITHKYVIDYIKSYIKASNAEIVGIDAAALIESGIYKSCDYVLSVLADKNIRIKRIMLRDRLTEEEASLRINSQGNDNFYIEKSDFIVYNNGNEENIYEEISLILDKIRSET